MSKIKLAIVVWCAILVTPNLMVRSDEPQEMDARPIKFAPQDPTVLFRIGGQSKLTTLTDAAAVEKLVGNDAAKALVALVDFKKEKLVLVSWTTGGPPDGVLKHEVKKEGKGRRLTFYVQGPIGAKQRGARARIGADFFAVPTDINVSFDPKER
jgi:hypothetical protein